jgi:hypothetical protein
VLIATEAGAVVTDAAGQSFDGRPLLGSAAEFQMSVAIASNHALHQRIVEAVAAGIERLGFARGANPAVSP